MDRRTFLKISGIVTAIIPTLKPKFSLAEMAYREHVKNKVSLLGFGCMRLPMKDKEVDIEKTASLFDYAIQHGVNYFDTAYPYLGGKSELAVGQLLKKYPRNSFYLADKMPIWMIKEPADADKIFEEQLKKCQVEYFDYYLVHAIDDSRYEGCEKNKIYETLIKRKKAGQIKNLGFSFHGTPELLEKICKSHQWDFVQLEINYVDWVLQNAKLQYEIAQKYKLPVIVMEPLRGGNLAKLNEKAVQVLKNVHPEASVASWAFRYVGSLSGVLTVLSGMNEMEHVRDNVATMSDFHPLTNEERQVLETARQVYSSSGTIACTGCRYCKDCPMKINISGLFASYNNFMMKEDKALGKWVLSRDYKLVTSNSGTADQCIHCGLCEESCPQHLPIREYLKMIASKIKEVS